jgi:hypothetical protein
MLFAVFGCVERDSSRLRIRGEITQRTVERVLSREPQTIVITSTGGVTTAGLDLAEIVAADGTVLELIGACASACAQLLMPSARQTVFKPQSFVVFHNTATAMQAVVSGDVDPRVRQFFDDRAARERGLYESRGVDPRLLLLPMHRMRVVCYSVLSGPNEEVLDVRWFAQLEGWSASPSVMERAGLSISGSVPANIAEFTDALEHNHSRIAAARFWFEEDEIVMSFEDLAQSLKETTRCAGQ